LAPQRALIASAMLQIRRVRSKKKINIFGVSGSARSSSTRSEARSAPMNRELQASAQRNADPNLRRSVCQFFCCKHSPYELILKWVQSSDMNILRVVSQKKKTNVTRRNRYSYKLRNRLQCYTTLLCWQE